MTSIAFEVVGTPAPQGSKRGFVTNGRVAMVESSKKVKPWRQDVKAAAIEMRQTLGHETFTGPVHVTVTFSFQRPKHHYRTGRNAHLLRDNAPTYVATKPDIEKLERSTYDALTEAGIWRDDCLVAQTSVWMTYCASDELPGAHILIESLDSPATPIGATA